MRLLPPSEHELGEYVDGRLSERRRAEIAAWLLEHPRKAAEVERLRELNETLRGIGSEVLDEPVPERLREILRRTSSQEEDPPHPAKRSSGFMEIAATFVVLDLGIVAGWGSLL